MNFEKKTEKNKKKYREQHRDEFNEKQRIRRKEKALEKQKKLLALRATQPEKTPEEIERLKQEAILKRREIWMRSWRKRFETNHEEINKKRRERYHRNEAENRAKSRAYSAASKHKKRFRTKTGKIIFPLLDAIIQSKLQK